MLIAVTVLRNTGFKARVTSFINKAPKPSIQTRVSLIWWKAVWLHSQIKHFLYWDKRASEFYMIRNPCIYWIHTHTHYIYIHAPSHNATIVKQFLVQRKVTVFNHPPYSPDLAPADYFLFAKVKSHLKGRLFDSISDIQKAVTRTLNTIAKDDFYKCIHKLYDRANLCVQLEGMNVEN